MAPSIEFSENLFIAGFVKASDKFFEEHAKNFIYGTAWNQHTVKLQLILA